MSITITAGIAPESPLLEVDDLVQRYTLPRENLFRAGGQVLALNGVSLQLVAGKKLGGVGGSRSRRSHFGRAGVGVGTSLQGSGGVCGGGGGRVVGVVAERVEAGGGRRARGAPPPPLRVPRIAAVSAGGRPGDHGR